MNHVAGGGCDAPPPPTFEACAWLDVLPHDITEHILRLRDASHYTDVLSELSAIQHTFIMNNSEMVTHTLDYRDLAHPSKFLTLSKHDALVDIRTQVTHYRKQIIQPKCPYNDGLSVCVESVDHHTYKLLYRDFDEDDNKHGL